MTKITIPTTENTPACKGLFCRKDVGGAVVGDGVLLAELVSQAMLVPLEEVKTIAEAVGVGAGVTIGEDTDVDVVEGVLMLVVPAVADVLTNQ